MARLTWGASPRRSEVTPITRPAVSTSAAPPKAALCGITMKARSSMYSHAAANDRTDCTWLAVATRSPSSETPTVPVGAPAATARESPRVAARHGAAPRTRGAEGGRRPRAGALQAGDSDAGLEIEPGQPRGHLAAVTKRDLDALGVEQQVAHRQDIALVGVEDDPAARALDSERGRGRPVGLDLDPDADHRGLDPADLARQRGHPGGLEAAVDVARSGGSDGGEGDAQQRHRDPGESGATHADHLPAHY